MAQHTLQLLIIEDRPADAELMVAALSSQGFRPEWRRVDSLDELRQALQDPPDVILSDFSLGPFTAMDAFEVVHGAGCLAPFIVVTGTIEEGVGIECVKRGAADYLHKDRLGRLGAAVDGALERCRLERERREAEKRVQRLNRMLDTMREVNHLVVRERDPAWLLAETCRIAVEHGELAVAWIGTVDDVSGRVLPVASAGLRAAEIAGAWASIDPEAAACPVCTAIRENRTVTVADVHDGSSGFSAWREKISACGFAASTSLPLVVNFRAYGVFTLLAEAPGVFDPEIVALLEELAADLCFALGALENSEQRRRAEESEHRRLEQLAALNRIGLTLSGCLDPATLLPTAVDEVRSAFDYHVVSILGVDAEPGEPRPWATARRPGTVAECDCLGRCPVIRAVAARTIRDGRSVSVDDIRRDPELASLTATPGECRSAIAVPILVGERLAAALVIQDHRPAIFETADLLTFETLAREISIAMSNATLFSDLGRELAERRRAEQALRVSEGRLASALRLAVMGHWEYDPRTGLLTFTDELFEMLRTTAAQSGGYTMTLAEYARRFAHPGDAALVEAEILPAALGRTRSDRGQYEHRVVRGDGTVAHIFVRYSVVRDEDGEVLRINGVDQDISDRRLLEEQLRHAQKMEAIGRLAGGVAHDFNNLLQAIISQTAMMRLDHAGDEQLDGNLCELEQIAQRGAAVTRQLLLVSRRSPTQLLSLDLRDAVQGAVGLLSRLVRENISLAVDLPDQPVGVAADRGQLEQVLMNLVVNACDAMAGGGRLTVRVESLGGCEAVLSIEDSGAGIPNEILDRLFEPFFTTKAEGRGTGLGLSVVHTIVAEHNGRVEVTSKVGLGSTFKVVLPLVDLAEQPAAARPLHLAPAARGQGEQVLVVEDEEAARVGLVRMLSSLGYSTSAAATIAEALQLTEDSAPELLLTDLVLPDGAGTGLIDRMRARRPDLRVVLMSGYTEDEALRHDIDTGAVHFLQKPFSLGQLATELHRALAGGRAAAGADTGGAEHRSDAGASDNPVHHPGTSADRPA